ncbi:hypothetical protein QAD02_003079 [Eretmocerus hayati]|uniref:Uncharacterized protein n=1 Tax=Eretmocerus hayati TaxID=131215 RepID=A0ACC2NQK4_9HYME|nr:hypothetical protein QAD02_003079 [Eretmocerus hayati]
MQGFKFQSNNEFIVKEVVIMNSKSEGAYHHWLFDPPCANDDLDFADWTTAEWLTRNHHGLNWDSGVVPYAGVTDHFEHTLIRECELDKPVLINVTGHEKREWLRILAQNSSPRAPKDR